MKETSINITVCLKLRHNQQIDLDHFINYVISELDYNFSSDLATIVDSEIINHKLLID